MGCVYRKDVEFTTVDGTILRGWIYPTDHQARAIIMAHGFTARRQLLLPQFAQLFREAGFTVLVYDNRGFGTSGGFPRFDVCPHKQIEDYHDAVTFMRNQPHVLVDEIVLWGYSFSGVCALQAAALDPRVASVIATSPALDTSIRADKLPELLCLAQRDREQQLQGNASILVKTIDDEGNSLFSAALSRSDEEVSGLDELLELAQRSTVTVQSYYKIAAWNPKLLGHLLADRHIMVIAGELDTFCLARSKRDLERAIISEDIASRLSDYSALHVEPGKTHFDILLGQDGLETIKKQIKWLLLIR